MILGFTAAVSAQSPEAKPAEALNTKPETKVVTIQKPVANVTPAKVVTIEKPVTNATPSKVAVSEKPVATATASKAAASEKPVAKEKPVRSTVVDTDLQFKESKAAKVKN